MVHPLILKKILIKNKILSEDEIQKTEKLAVEKNTTLEDYLIKKGSYRKICFIRPWLIFTNFPISI